MKRPALSKKAWLTLALFVASIPVAVTGAITESRAVLGVAYVLLALTLVARGWATESSVAQTAWMIVSLLAVAVAMLVAIPLGLIVLLIWIHIMPRLTPVQPHERR